MKAYIADDTVDYVTSPSHDGIVNVIYGPGYVNSIQGLLSCSLHNHGNGYKVSFYDHVFDKKKKIKLDYDEARNLVLALAEFKKDLGFEE